jgi:ribose transport system substrate-binding protein
MKRALLVLAILLMVGAVVFAGGGKESAATKKDDGKIRIGFSIQDITNPSWSEMWIYMERKAKDLGVEITLSDCQADPNRQISSIENFIQGGYDAIIVHCFDAESATSTIQKAKDKGIKVLAYDTYVDIADCYYGLDNYEVGRQIAKNAATWINSTFPNGVVEVGVDRAEGILSGMAEFAPNAKIVAQAQAGYMDEGLVVGENWIVAHPNIKAFVGIDDAGLLGIYEAYKSAGKLRDDMGMFAIDALPETLKIIDSGGIFRSTIYLDLNGVGEQMVQASVDMVRGIPVERMNYFIMVNLDETNVRDYM